MHPQSPPKPLVDVSLNPLSIPPLTGHGCDSKGNACCYLKTDWTNCTVCAAGTPRESSAPGPCRVVARSTTCTAARCPPCQWLPLAWIQQLNAQPLVNGCMQRAPVPTMARASPQTSPPPPRWPTHSGPGGPRTAESVRIYGCSGRMLNLADPRSRLTDWSYAGYRYGDYNPPVLPITVGGGSRIAGADRKLRPTTCPRLCSHLLLPPLAPPTCVAPRHPPHPPPRPRGPATAAG